MENKRINPLTRKISTLERFFEKNYIYKKVTDKAQFMLINYSYDFSKSGLSSLDQLIVNLSESEISDYDFYAAYVIESLKDANNILTKQYLDSVWREPFILIGSKDGKTISGVFIMGLIPGLNDRPQPVEKIGRAKKQ